MKIGFDLDKVFIDYPPFVPDILIDRLYRGRVNGSLHYRMPSRPEQYLRRLSHTPIFRPPIVQNIAFLKELAKTEHSLYLISSRFRFLESVTQTLTQKYAFDSLFDRMYFNFNNKQPHVFKNEILQQLTLDTYVDDDLSLLSYISKDNPTTKLFWLAHPKLHRDVTPPIFAIDKLSCILDKDYA